MNSLPVTPTIYQIDSPLRAPYASQAGIGVERQIAKTSMLSVTYLNTHGVHQLISREYQCPDPANPGDARPDAPSADLYQYESAGLYNQNQMITNFNVRASKFSLFGFYTLNYADSNTPASRLLSHEPIRSGRGLRPRRLRHTPTAVPGR